MIVWGELGHLEHTWPEYTHRYLLRGIERHCAWSDKHDKVFVYSKMGPVLIVGFATGEKKEGWMGTNVGRLRGRVPEENIVLTAGFADYLKDRINRASSVKGKISVQQKNKIKKTIVRNKDRFATSDQMEAILADARTFGVNSVVEDK